MEINGALKSWAIFKNPLAKKGVKRLAIQTKNHSIDYADFEGVISKEPSNAESVEIWDKGTYEIDEKEKD
mgnify:CR=1 FL=1